MMTRNYKEDLYSELKDPEFASGYLSECFNLGREEFLLGLKEVVEANGGIGLLAKNTHLNRENLYTLLSEKGNPRLDSLTQVLDALNLRLQFAPKINKEREAA
ncbi:MAG: transcriptional regulator [Deltaproteobacteria bacterium]|nr:transcriptional regulator [Deltaproteobacteria bacterium]